MRFTYSSLYFFPTGLQKQTFNDLVSYISVIEIREKTYKQAKTNEQTKTLGSGNTSLGKTWPKIQNLLFYLFFLKINLVSVN